MKVIVAAPVRLKVSPTKTRNGRTIKFSGSVPQAGKARTRVELQAWANGKWVPFKTVALKNGRFRAGYRFMRTFIAQRYRFRAVIQDDPNFRVRGRAVEGGAGAGAAVGRPGTAFSSLWQPGVYDVCPSQRGGFVIHVSSGELGAARLRRRAGLYPAIRAARLSPTEALRSV